MLGNFRGNLRRNVSLAGMDPADCIDQLVAKHSFEEIAHSANFNGAGGLNIARIRCEDHNAGVGKSILKAFVHFNNFNRASRFSTWLTRISINSALMMLRKKRVRPEISIDVSSDHGSEVFQWEIADRRANPEDLYLRHEINARLQAAISHLPRTYRDVVEIRQQSEGSLKVVAGHVGITLAATKSRMMRAAKVLRNSLS
jgi:RNA polymerase sigma-70 factor (ECF subfamily)